MNNKKTHIQEQEGMTEIQKRQSALKKERDENFKHFRSALEATETGFGGSESYLYGREGVITKKKNRALGRYQIMRSNWPVWAEETFDACKNRADALAMCGQLEEKHFREGWYENGEWKDKHVQDLVFEFKIKQYFDKLQKGNFANERQDYTNPEVINDVLENDGTLNPEVADQIWNAIAVAWYAGEGVASGRVERDFDKKYKYESQARKFPSITSYYKKVQKSMSGFKKNEPPGIDTWVAAGVTSRGRYRNFYQNLTEREREFFDEGGLSERWRKIAVAGTKEQKRIVVQVLSAMLNGAPVDKEVARLLPKGFDPNSKSMRRVGTVLWLDWATSGFDEETMNDRERRREQTSQTRGAQWSAAEEEVFIGGSGVSAEDRLLIGIAASAIGIPEDDDTGEKTRYFMKQVIRGMPFAGLASIDLETGIFIEIPEDVMDKSAAATWEGAARGALRSFDNSYESMVDQYAGNLADQQLAALHGVKCFDTGCAPLKGNEKTILGGALAIAGWEPDLGSWTTVPATDASAAEASARSFAGMLPGGQSPRQALKNRDKSLLALRDFYKNYYTMQHGDQIDFADPARYNVQGSGHRRTSRDDYPEHLRDFGNLRTYESTAGATGTGANPVIETYLSTLDFNDFDATQAALDNLKRVNITDQKHYNSLFDAENNVLDTGIESIRSGNFEGSLGKGVQEALSSDDITKLSQTASMSKKDWQKSRKGTLKSPVETSSTATVGDVQGGEKKTDPTPFRTFTKKVGSFKLDPADSSHTGKIGQYFRKIKTRAENPMDSKKSKAREYYKVGDLFRKRYAGKPPPTSTVSDLRGKETTVTHGAAGIEAGKAERAKKKAEKGRGRIGNWLQARKGTKFAKKYGVKQAHNLEEEISAVLYESLDYERELLTEGGAGSHMAHPFDLPWVKTGKDLLEFFTVRVPKYFEEGSTGSIKTDGINVSFKLVSSPSITGVTKREFAVDRGSKMPIDVEGITIDRIGERFAEGHGMRNACERLLTMLNSALESGDLQTDLEEIGMWDNPNLYLNTEYVLETEERPIMNAIKYDENFIAIHGVLEWGPPPPVGPRPSTAPKMNRSKARALDSFCKKLRGFSKVFNVYGPNDVIAIPKGGRVDINYDRALATPLDINLGAEGVISQTIGAWLRGGFASGEEVTNPGKAKIIIAGGRKIDALHKDVYFSLIKHKMAVDELFGPEAEDNKIMVLNAINAAIFWHATRELGNAVLDALKSPVGPDSARSHEGLVLNNREILGTHDMDSDTVKITGDFIEDGAFGSISQLVATDKTAQTQDEAPPSVAVASARTVALVPGAFKAPHKGHLEMVKHYATTVNADVVYVFISPTPRGAAKTEVEVSFRQSKEIWKTYIAAEGLGQRVKVIDKASDTNTPVAMAYEFIANEKNQPDLAQDGDLIVLGASVKPDKYGKPDWMRFAGADQYIRDGASLANVESHASPSFFDDLSGTAFREALLRADIEELQYYLPESVLKKPELIEKIFSILNVQSQEEPEIAPEEELAVSDDMSLAELLTRLVEGELDKKKKVYMEPHMHQDAEAAPEGLEEISAMASGMVTGHANDDLDEKKTLIREEDPIIEEVMNYLLKGQRYTNAET